MRTSLGAFLMFISLIPLTSASQESGVEVRYDVLFNSLFDRSASQFQTLKGRLFIGNDSAQFYMLPEIETEETDSKVFISQDTTWRVLIAQDQPDLFFEHMDLTEQEVGWFKDSLYPMIWKLLPDTKYVDSLRCQKASCWFRGRDYVAWYAPAYPYQYGPWKFGGLPGLIVELEDMKQDLQFHLVSIKKSVIAAFPKVETTKPISELIIATNMARQRYHQANAIPDCLTCSSKIKFFTWESTLFID